MTALRSDYLKRGLAIMALLLGAAGLLTATTQAQEVPSQTFRETGKTVQGRFLQYWANHGGTAIQGLPITDEMPERSDTDGQTYTVQYFERAIFEYHPENAGTPYEVLLALLGVQYYQQKYPHGAPGQVPNTASGARLFPETGKRVGCQFLAYWERNGGLAQFGYPISDEFDEVSDLDGITHRVQYFERAVFEWHGENDVRQAVLLAQLGTYRHRAKYAPPGPATTPAAGCVPTVWGPSNSDQYPDPPVRASVGQGHVLQGRVRSSRDCAPLPNAKIIFWTAGPDGQYDSAHEAAVFTDSAGAYRFESNYPGYYGAGGPHIHLYASARGHRTVEAEYFAYCNATQGTFDLVLAPETP